VLVGVAERAEGERGTDGAGGVRVGAEVLEGLLKALRVKLGTLPDGLTLLDHGHLRSGACSRTAPTEERQKWPASREIDGRR
jgi:hypothetical protein